MTRRNPAPLASLPPKEASEFFTRALMQWHAHDNFRQMPWKGEKSPYRIWLSEIILQQTRVEQGWAYYEKFISAYPDVSALASASDAEVFKMWEGLGYYARCRNLLKAARKVVADFGEYFHVIMPHCCLSMVSDLIQRPLSHLSPLVFPMQWWMEMY